MSLLSILLLCDKLGMDPENVLVYEYGHLSRKTDNFSESNFVGRCQFGKLHRGMTNHPCDGGLRHFLVKTWEESEIDNYRRGDHLLRLMVCCLF